jgi:hypothetical protein
MIGVSQRSRHAELTGIQEAFLFLLLAADIFWNLANTHGPVLQESIVRWEGGQLRIKCSLRRNHRGRTMMQLSGMGFSESLPV